MLVPSGAAADDPWLAIEVEEAEEDMDCLRRLEDEAADLMERERVVGESSSCDGALAVAEEGAGPSEKRGRAEAVVEDEEAMGPSMDGREERREVVAGAASDCEEDETPRDDLERGGPTRATEGVPIAREERGRAAAAVRASGPGVSIPDDGVGGTGGAGLKTDDVLRAVEGVAEEAPRVLLGAGVDPATPRTPNLRLTSSSSCCFDSRAISELSSSSLRSILDRVRRMIVTSFLASSLLS